LACAEARRQISISTVGSTARRQMILLVALRTKGNQIVQVVISECAAKPEVVNLQVGRAAALLTSPAVSFENLTAKYSVGVGLQLDSRTSWAD
jgi:hypothetical protein